jgi:hypothetical protein
MTTYGQGGTANWLFSPPNAVFGLGSTSPLSGLNLQSPFNASTGNMRGAVCSDAYWNNTNQNWAVGNNGGFDYTCGYFPGSGGFGISATSSIQQPFTVTQAQFTANTHFYVNGNGNLILGSGAASAADTGQALQVNGGVQLASSAAKPSCTSTVRGTFWFSPASAGAQDHVQVCAQNGSGTLGWQQIY